MKKSIGRGKGMNISLLGLVLVAVLALTLVTFTSCAKKAETNEEAQTETGESARLSLDYAGTYKGVLPCADCEGIETVIEITEDGIYTRLTTYLGKEEKASEEKGTYTWDETGNIITFDGVEDSSSFFVGENTLTILDMEGNKVVGELADNYILHKDIAE